MRAPQPSLRTLFCLAALILGSLSGGAWAQGLPCLYPRLLSFVDVPASTRGMTLVGTTMFVAAAPDGNGVHKGFYIFDVSDPAAPVEISRTYNATCLDVEVVGDTAYLLTPLGIISFDISDLSNPIRFNTFDPGSPVSEAVFEGTIGYIGTNNGLKIVDFSDRHNPVTIGVHGTRAGFPTWGGDDRIYYATTTGIELLDVSDPTSPALIGSFAGSLAGNVAVDGDTVYANFHTTLRAIDFSDPTAPVEISFYRFLSRAPLDLTVYRSMLYVPRRGTLLRVLDISDPTTMSPIGTYNTRGQYNTLSIVDGTGYARTSRGIELWDIGANPPPTSGSVARGSFLTEHEACDIKVVGTTAYIANAQSGLLILDIADPYNPVVLGTHSTPFLAVSVDVMGSTAYVADYTSLQIFDVSDPTAPVLVNTYDDGRVHNMIFVDGDTGYLADWTRTRILDLSDPHAPVAAGEPIRAGAESITIVGDTAYLQGGALNIVDVSDLSSPVILGTYGAGRPMMACDVVGTTAYVTAGDYGTGLLQTVDVSNPEMPVMLASVDWVGSRARGLVVEGDTAYVASDYDRTLHLADIRDPFSPEFLAQTNLSRVTRLALESDAVFIAGESGLTIIDVSDDCGPSCAVDFTGDGIVDVFDAFAFIDAFNASDVAADFTGDGALDIFDVFAFLDAFNAGCP